MPEIHCHYCGGGHERALQVKACASRHDFKALPRIPVVEDIRDQQVLPPRTPLATWQHWVAKIGLDKGGSRRYALREHKGNEETVGLYELFRTPSGYVHVSRVTSHGGTRTEVVKSLQADILYGISQDPAGAGALYGRVTRHCSRCHKFLSTDASKAAGYGPDCYEIVYGVKQPKVSAA